MPETNKLLHGGLERGTMIIVSGPSGTGKTTVGAQFMKKAAGRGERSVLFMFDEVPATLIHRAESVSIPTRDMIDRGMLSLIPIDPLAVSPDELAAQRGAIAVMLDSVVSYQLSVVGGDEESGTLLLSRCRTESARSSAYPRSGPAASKTHCESSRLRRIAARSAIPCTICGGVLSETPAVQERTT